MREVDKSSGVPYGLRLILNQSTVQVKRGIAKLALFVELAHIPSQRQARGMVTAWGNHVIPSRANARSHCQFEHRGGQR